MKPLNAASASDLVSAIQISCNERLAFACRLFGSLFKTFAVLCTQQRCARVFGHTSSTAFQKPRAPSATASCGPVVKPRRLRSSSSSFQDCALSRMPSARPTSSFLPSAVAPMITSRHCASSSSRAVAFRGFHLAALPLLRDRNALRPNMLQFHRNSDFLTRVHACSAQTMRPNGDPLDLVADFSPSSGGLLLFCVISGGFDESHLRHS